MSTDKAMVTDCDCTKVAHDETCPVGYPSLLCEACDGKGVVPAALAQAEQPVAYIVTEALAELRKHKDASATVWSGLNSGHPFNKDATPLYAHPPAKREAGETAAPDTPAPHSHVVGRRFVNIADQETYVVTSEVSGFVHYEREDLTNRHAPRYLGREEFDRRFLPAPSTHVMVSDEMVEAAARAMCDAWCYAPIGTPDGDAEWDRKQDQYRKQARAGLFAALSPSGAAE